MPPLLLVLSVGFALLALGATNVTLAQEPGFERLPASVLDVVPPAARVRGIPGTMAVTTRACRTLPTADTRRRIVDVAVQEWAFFGFRLAAATDTDDGDVNDNSAGSGDDAPDGRRRRPRLSPAEAARVASSIAGYWAVTQEGPWIVGKQNERWNGTDGVSARWNAPWSAAFVSWVMCEAGLGTSGQFQRAIAHHTYIDQALRSRDAQAPQAAFAAYDMGEATIAPGDILCSSRRPVYRTLAERRRQIGTGARSHCDVVVKVDEPRERILAIGGNVRGVVSLKVFPAVRQPGGPLRLRPSTGGRPMFAHLKLRAAPVDASAFDTSPAVAASRCAVGGSARIARAAVPLAAAGIAPTRC